MVKVITNGKLTVKLYQSVNRGKTMYQLALIAKRQLLARQTYCGYVFGDQRKPPFRQRFVSRPPTSSGQEKAWHTIRLKKGRACQRSRRLDFMDLARSNRRRHESMWPELPPQLHHYG
jgi:hypothetical protein